MFLCQMINLYKTKAQVSGQSVRWLTCTPPPADLAISFRFGESCPLAEWERQSSQLQLTTIKCIHAAFGNELVGAHTHT